MTAALGRRQIDGGTHGGVRRGFQHQELDRAQPQDVDDGVGRCLLEA